MRMTKIPLLRPPCLVEVLERIKTGKCWNCGIEIRTDEKTCEECLYEFKQEEIREEIQNLQTRNE